ncbi:VanZ family protein [Kurthia sibirica]|uniref:VanZ family protein n=1 Tax=Kurthia sibirica TaxID=202750 RepID=A0A2U3AKK6_9BACL|nr:VanZ family protein [Kurthia sibirica]PWI25052.1 VanZ family protein [Kurthia sibirica]GEK34217.1 membrane protein [Kurthia sibirica]
MKKYIPLALLIVIIFISSSQSYEQQSIVPTLQKLLPNQPLFDFLSLFHIPYWGIDVSIQERGYYYFLEFLIRKAAHMLSFGAIAIALYIALYPRKRRYLYALVITFALACADELHQSFTIGRTATMSDVWLDTVGGLICLTLFTVILRLFKKKKTKEKQFE